MKRWPDSKRGSSSSSSSSLFLAFFIFAERESRSRFVLLCPTLCLLLLLTAFFLNNNKQRAYNCFFLVILRLYSTVSYASTSSHTDHTITITVLLMLIIIFCILHKQHHATVATSLRSDKCRLARPFATSDVKHLHLCSGGPVPLPVCRLSLVVRYALVVSRSNKERKGSKLRPSSLQLFKQFVAM